MIEYKSYTLQNGLRVVHNFDPTTSMVAVDVLYNVGARDESRSLTGIAHLFEHLMFGGSINVPDYDKVITEAAGTNNAWTSSDFTNFHCQLPAANFDTALYLESDRMLSLSFNPQALQVQRSVVVEEFKQQCLNRPYGDLMHGLRAALYAPEHPYSWPVIGLEPQHILNATDDDVRRWFFAHYAPNNAVLAVSGNVPYDLARERIEHWFGDIPRREIAPRNLPPCGFPSQDQYVHMRGPVPSPMVIIAIPMDPYGTPDYYAADTITDLLSAGRSGSIYQHLVARGDGSIIEADASIIGSEHPGFVLFTAHTASDADLNHVAEALLHELELLTHSGEVTDYRLQRTFNRFATTHALSNLDQQARAFNLALADIHGHDINQALERRRQTTVAHIQDLAARLLHTPKVILTYTK